MLFVFFSVFNFPLGVKLHTKDLIIYFSWQKMLTFAEFPEVKSSYGGGENSAVCKAFPVWRQTTHRFFFTRVLFPLGV